MMLLSAQLSIAAKSMSKREFIAIAFKDTLSIVQPSAKIIWLKDEIQLKITKILDHRYPKLRLRYWQSINDGIGQTVWFLDHIGKERPISFGISIINNRVHRVQVLAFRESRGGEIQMKSFGDQFKNIGLNSDSQLDQNIDGISGATMSVSAMKKVTRVALMLNREISK